MLLGNKDDLYQLIHSLSKSEKRHFKLSIVYDENSQYMRLFDIINDIKKYSKSLLQEKTQAEGWTEEQVVAMRHYLYKLILKSLRQLHENQDIDGQITVLLQNARLFFQRSHFTRCQYYIEKAKNLARCFEKLSWELKTLEEEKKLIDSSFQDDDRLFLIENERIDQAYKHCLQRLQNQQVYAELLLQSQRLSQATQGEITSEHPLEVMLKHPLLQSINTTESLLAKHYFYSTRLQCFFFLRRPDLYANEVLACAQLWQNYDKAFKIEHQHLYISSLYNLLIYYAFSQKDDEFRAILAQLKQLLKDSAFSPSHDAILVKILGIELHFLSDRGQIQTALTQINSQLANFVRISSKVAAKDAIATAFVIGRCYFYGHQFQQAQEWFQQLLQQYRKSQREDLLLVARCLQAIAEFELHRPQLVEYLSRSTHRFSQHRNNIYRLPLLVLQYLEKLATTFSSFAHANIYTEMKDKALDLLNSPQEKNILSIFNFMIWIESHLQHRKMWELLENI